MSGFQKFLDKLTDLPILKRRVLYIVGVVVFTILFLVFLLMALLLPMTMRMMERGFDTEEAAGAPADRESIPDADREVRAEDFAYEENGEDWTYTDGEPEEAMAGNPAAFTAQDRGFLSRGVVALRVLAIVFAALDALCIFMLVYLRRKKRRRLEEEDRELRRQAAEEGEVYRKQEEPKKKRNPYIVWIIVAVVIVVAILVARGVTSRNRAAASQTEATLHTGTAEMGNISEVLPGAGTLTEDDAEEMSLPEGVEIQKWYASNGETVKTGQQLAKVDPVSVMTTIVEVQDKLDELDEGLAECENQTASGTITAPADGRVIKIYATNGTPVVDTMYDHSALMLLSLDGLMAVSIDTDVSLTAGDPVVVTLSDGTEVDGRVNTVTYHTAVITISDDGPTLGDTVSVKTQAGRSIGEGDLYIHSEWKATGFVGTVSGIPVTEGQEVSSGSTLLSLTDTEDTGAYNILLEQRGKLEQQMEALFEVYTDGYLYASCDGVIAGLDMDQSESASSSGEASGDEEEAEGMSFHDGQMGDTGNAEAINLVSRETSVRLVSLADTRTLASTEGAGEVTETALSDLYTLGIVNRISGNEVSVTWLNGEEAEGAVSLPDRVSLYKDGKFTYEASLEDIEVGDLLIFLYDGEEIRSVICMAANSSGDESGYEEGYTEGREEGYTEGRDEGYTSGYEEGYAKAREELGDSGSSGSTGSTGSTGNSGNISDLGGYGDLSDLYGGLDGDVDLSGYGDLGDLYGDSNGDVDLSGYGDLSDLLGDYGDLSDLYDIYGDIDLGDYGDLSGQYGNLDLGDLDLSELEELEEAERRNETTEADVEEVYGVDEETLCSITPQDTMMVTITVDEMDVLKLKKGMGALITLDAFPGQSFEGTVSAVHRSGTNSGGHSKYTADITIDRESGMLAGMNASAQITVGSVEDVLCVPEAALLEEDGVEYVYTTYSENQDELGGKTEVTTGASDGTNVQILSGLEEGSEYFYKYYDVVNYESASSVSDNRLF